MRRTIIALTTCLLSGCTVNSGVKTTPTFTAARPVTDIPRSEPYTGPRLQPAVGAVGLAAVRDANRGAIIRPTTASMAGASWVIEAYNPNSIYEVALAPRMASTILLPPGEQFNAATGGNVPGFLISISYAGPRPAISILPRAGGAKGNLQIATTAGLYSFLLVTTRHTAINIVDVHRDGDAPRSGQMEASPQPQGDFTPLRFTSAEGEELPAWAPAEVWADSVKMVVRFNGPLPVMPGLYAGGNGEQMVNYHTVMSNGSPILVTSRRVTEAQLRINDEVIDITARAPERESKAATNTIDPAWMQAESLPDKPAGQPTINVVVMPGDGTMPAAVFTDEDLLGDVQPVDLHDEQPLAPRVLGSGVDG